MSDSTHAQDKEYLESLVVKLSPEGEHNVVKALERLRARYYEYGLTKAELGLYFAAQGLLSPNYRGCSVNKRFNLIEEKTNE